MSFIQLKKIIDYTKLNLDLRPVTFFTDEELLEIPAGEVFIFDVECFPNYFYIAFKHLKSGKYVAFELSADNTINFDKLGWLMWRFCIVGFNSRNYDLPMITYAMSGANCEELKAASDVIIATNIYPQQFCKIYDITIPQYNHIDLIEVAPLQGSLKLYAGRLHCKTMQDLPYKPSEALTAEQATIVAVYCCNDLDNTELLFNELAPEIELRINMSNEYGIDLKSKSDAQIAEAVINNELKKVLGYYPQKPKIDLDKVLAYRCPTFICFQTKPLQNMLEVVKKARFYLDGRGSPIMPEELEKLSVRLGSSVYKMGMGGLHSQEKQIAHKASEELILSDFDVASFYPRIILNQGLFPTHLGEAFLEVYEGIVNQRIEAKKQGNKTISDSLKITINGSFGKMGNKYSTLYAPQLMLQVTLTGQLVLLMLIEMMEKAGISVVSGNTDGIICKYSADRIEDVKQLNQAWMDWTGFELEETRYKATYNRDVNNYIALKEKGNKEANYLDERLGCKTKGAYCERGSALNSTLSKNPEHLICSDAVLNYLTHNIPVEETIRSCQDVRRFVSVRNVKGGGEKDGIYLGKVVRWYYAKNETGYIAYVGSGNKVAKTDGAKPLMQLPDKLPADIDYDWYIENSTTILIDCGAIEQPKTGLLW